MTPATDHPIARAKLSGTEASEEAPTNFYVRLTDDGQHIRQWDRKRFDGATAYVLAAFAKSTPVAEQVERAWRDGFLCAKQCLTEAEAFYLTGDVEDDAWVDSATCLAATRSIGSRTGAGDRVAAP